MPPIKKLLRKAKNNSLLRDSAIIFSASMIVNVLNYVFQLYVGRSLGPAGYSIFASVVSLLYIVSVPSATINTSVAKFVSGFKGRKEFSNVKYLFLKVLKKMLFFGFFGFILIAVASPYLAAFLNIGYSMPVIILGMIFFVSMLSPVGTGTLVGLQRFKGLGASQVAGALAKLVLGIVLVGLGLGVSGALASVFLSGLFGLVLSIWFTRDILKRKAGRFDRNKFLSYSFPVFVSMFLVSAVSNIDIVLVKHYFADVEAGHYAAAALLGKVVLFASAAISGVMFAKVAEMKAASRPTRRLLFESMFYVFGISFAAITVYFVAPHFILSLLFGSSYIGAVPLIGLFGLAMGFFALSSLLVQYNLAIRETRFIYVLFFALVAEVVMIVMYHESLLTVVKILTTTMALVFSGVLMITAREIVK